MGLIETVEEKWRRGRDGDFGLLGDVGDGEEG